MSIENEHGIWPWCQSQLEKKKNFFMKEQVTLEKYFDMPNLFKNPTLFFEKCLITFGPSFCKNWCLKYFFVKFWTDKKQKFFLLVSTLFLDTELLINRGCSREFCTGQESHYQ